jgi:hypothetical protein
VAEELGWYISDVHCKRAIDYLFSELKERELVNPELTPREFSKMWAQALGETMAVKEPSPIGPDPELAREFVLAGIEARVTHLEERAGRAETAIMKLGSWQTKNQRVHRGIEKILYGTEITPETSSPSAE